MTESPGLAGRSDRELVLAFQAGDDLAYDELFRRHHERVSRVCQRFLNNSTDAEEAAQETFLKAFQALPRFNGEFQVGAWLARIAANVCVDHLRVKSRTHLVALPSEERLVVKERGPEEILVGEHPRIDVAINEIQPLHADALKMRALDGMSHLEMAGRLDMTPSQVKALLHRARSSFKKAWNKAQGWLLAPLVKARSLDRSSHVSNTSSNLAAVSAQAPAIAERAAASVLIVMVALSGAPSSAPDVPKVALGAPELGEGRNAAPDSTWRLAARTDTPASSEAQVAEEQVIVEAAIALPDTLTSTVEGHNQVDPDDPAPDPTPEGSEQYVPPTVKESPRKAQSVVKETLETLNH